MSKEVTSSRASTEGGTSTVYKYSDELGTKYLIHEVTDANGYIIHRDFDAVRISSGQIINTIRQEFVMYYREFETIIRKILDEDFEKNLLMQYLKADFDCEKIYDSNEKMLTDIFFTLKHYASGEEDIRKEEWQYFLDCISGKREYNLEEKMRITTKPHV